MKNPRNFYKYVDDTILLEEIKKVLNVVKNALNDVDQKIHSNVLDPFSAFFESAHHNITYEQWLEQEKIRQVQKTLQNQIGYFHQGILGAIDGWKDLGHGGGLDIESEDQKIIAEIKNKHNTMNSTSSVGTYDKISHRLKTDKKGFIGYVVTIIPKTSTRFKKPFQPSIDGKPRPKRKDILLVDGATFYEVVTGDRNGLEMLFKALPDATRQVLKISKKDFNPEANLFLELFKKAFEE